MHFIFYGINCHVFQYPIRRRGMKGEIGQVAMTDDMMCDCTMCHIDNAWREQKTERTSMSKPCLIISTLIYGYQSSGYLAACIDHYLFHERGIMQQINMHPTTTSSLNQNQSVFCCLYSRLSSRLHCKSLFTLRKLSQLS